MFRLFLKKKLLAGDTTSAGPVRPPADRRNRRVFARYNIDHKHLTVMNEADILLIREISAKGFSTEVSPRGFERLVIGDVYEARIRYLGEIYDLQARVTWKADNFVGFEIIDASRETLLFLKRLLKPVEIAMSLAPVESSFMTEGQSGKSWYHGDDDSDLYIWHHEATQALTAWQLTVGELYVEWRDGMGLTTGTLSGATDGSAIMGAHVKGLAQTRDASVDPKKRQFAIDVIMALQYPIREELLETLSN